MITQGKLEILKAKIERVIKTGDAPRVDFLGIIASHNGFIMQDSISFSFRRFNEKYGSEKSEEILKEFKEDGVIVEKYGLRFAVFDEKGEFDYKAGEELARFTGKLIFENKPQIRQVIDEILQEPEGKELLKFIANEKGVNIIDGQEPEIKQLVGKRTYELTIEKLVKNNVIVEYAWSSRKHSYSGYKLLPFVDNYLKGGLGIVEVTNGEKIALSYIGYFNEIFSEPFHWYVWFNYPTEYEHRVLELCSLHKKFLASLIHEEKEIERILKELKEKNLLTETDLGYTRSGSHRGLILQLSDSGQRFAFQIKEELKNKIDSKVKEIFSNVENRVTYYLFSQEKVPLKLLSLIKKESVDLLLKAGLISDKQGVFLAFKEGTSYHNYITSEIFPERIQNELKEECLAILSPEEKLFLGFLSQCRNIILEKCADWKAWSYAAARTQRSYKVAYNSLISNFPHLKKLFSYLASLPTEEIDKIVSKLEKNGFLIQERASLGFPGYAITYRIPVKFDFNINTETLKTKIKEYIRFLAEDVKNYDQLIFLDYLTQLYDARQCDFLVNVSLIKDFFDFFNYKPPSRYLPIYAFEDEVILLHPWVKEELKREIFERKLKLIEPIKSIVLKLTEGYRNNIHNFLEKTTKEGYFILEIESPNPSVGTVTFVLTPWISPFDIKEINALCAQSNTINLLTFYPNYPQLKSMTANINGRYNLVIIRNRTAHLFEKRVDQITQAFLEELSKEFEIVREAEEIDKEIKELEKNYPNLMRVRHIISEAEILLRNTIRSHLIKEFGDNWEDEIRRRFPKAEKRKQDWGKRHSSEQVDILQGISLGDFKTLFEDKSFSFLKNIFKDFELAKASIQAFLKRKEYHHGRPADGKDILKEEVDVISTAFATLQKMMKY